MNLNRTLRRATAAAATLAASAALPLAMALPASAGVHHSDGSCSASGQQAECSFDHGNVYHPGTLHLNVTASPNQKVDVFYDVSCDKHSYSVFSDQSGQFVATTPVNKVLPHPLWHPTHCDTFVDVFLDSGPGSLHAALTYTRWDGK